MIEEAPWLASRSAGIAAYILLWFSVLWGLALSTRVAQRLSRSPAILEAHRWSGISILGFTAIHVLALLADRYYSWTVVSLFIPFASEYRPFAVGLGVLSLYLVVVINLSFAVRRAIGVATWRRIHYLSFGLFLMATLHGITAGSGSAEWWMRGIYLTATFSVLFLLNVRLLGGLAAGALAPEKKHAVQRLSPRQEEHARG